MSIFLHLSGWGKQEGGPAPAAPQAAHKEEEEERAFMAKHCFVDFAVHQHLMSDDAIMVMVTVMRLLLT